MLAFATLLVRAATKRLLARGVHVETRIAELGLELPPLGTPKGSYALTSRCGNLLFLSGHLPLPIGGDLITGKVGKDISADKANEAAKWVGLNLISTLKAELGDLDNVVKIHKLVGFVNCVDDFYAQPGVVNGCSDLMVDVFGEVESTTTHSTTDKFGDPQAGRHARSAVGTNALPLNVPVEIEAIVEIKS